jgi:hypothetical protein
VSSSHQLSIAFAAFQTVLKPISAHERIPRSE